MFFCFFACLEIFDYWDTRHYQFCLLGCWIVLYSSKKKFELCSAVQLRYFQTIWSSWVLTFFFNVLGRSGSLFPTSKVKLSKFSTQYATNHKFFLVWLVWMAPFLACNPLRWSSPLNPPPHFSLVCGSFFIHMYDHYCTEYSGGTICISLGSYLHVALSSLVVFPTNCLTSPDSQLQALN